MPSQPAFASTIVDLGMVVRDLEASVEFYTEAIGFIEVIGFSVPPDLAGDSGLTDYQPLEISVLKLNVDESVPSTDLKLMQVPDVETSAVSRPFVHATYGINYISLFVSDMGAALKRLEDAGVVPEGKGAVAMPFEIAVGVLLRPQVMEQMMEAGEDGPGDMPEEVLMAVVKDPDGNFVELLGPRTPESED